MAKQNWITENEALEKMGLKDAQYFRRKVKNGHYNISYRSRPSGKGYEYDANAIEKVKNQNAVIIH